MRILAGARFPSPSTPTLDDDLRRCLKALVASAIDFLDMLDAAAGDGDDEPGDVDEDGGDAEPSLAAPEAKAARMDQRSWALGSDSDRELAAERPRRAAAAPEDRAGFVPLRPGAWVRYADPLPTALAGDAAR